MGKRSSSKIHAPLVQERKWVHMLKYIKYNKIFFFLLLYIYAFGRLYYELVLFEVRIVTEKYLNEVKLDRN